MPTYTVQAPNGKTYSIDGPAGASETDVRSQVLAQHPEAGGQTLPPTPRSPAPVPVTTKRADIAKAATANSGGIGGWLSDVAGGLESGADAALGGIPSRLMAAARYYLPNGGEAAPGTAGAAGNSNIPRQGSYQDQLDLERQIQDKKATAAPVSNVIGQLATGIAPGMAIDRGIAAAGRGIARGAAAVAPKAVAAVGRVAAKAPAIVRAGRAAATGAVLGGAQAAGTGDATDLGNIGGGAAQGAAIGAGLSAAGSVAKATGIPGYLADRLGISSAQDILKRYTQTTPEDIQRLLANKRAQGVPNPTIAEVLEPEDQQKIQAIAKRMPAVAQAHVNGLLGQRADSLSREMAGTATDVTANDRANHVATLGQTVADSRGAPAASPDDLALADRAAASPTDMQVLRRQVSSNIMAPHDNAPLFANTDALHPTTMQTTPGTPQPSGILDPNTGQPIMRPGQPVVSEVRSNPDQSRMIDAATGTLPLRPADQPITGNDLTHILSTLRDQGREAGVDGLAARGAAQHIEGLLADTPAGEAIGRMREAHAANSRVLEGMTEGAKGVERDAVQVGTNADKGRYVENAYDTPEGQMGRQLGQANALRRNFAADPGSAVTPGNVQAVRDNIGAYPAMQLEQTQAAQAQSTRTLANIGQVKGADGDADTAELARALTYAAVGHPAAAAGKWAGVIAHAIPNLPPQASQQLAHMLFSQDPKAVALGLHTLRRAGVPGQAAIQALRSGIQSWLQPGPVDDPGSEPLGEAPVAQPIPNAPNAPAPVDPGALPVAGAPVDPATSPYLPNLKSTYGDQAPEFQSFVDKVQHQESKGNQHDKAGKPLTSSAGAVGIMQVEPKTAKATAKELGIPWDENAFYHDAVYNKTIGTHYLGTLLQQFGGDTRKAAAAYNAGPSAVIKALKSGGSWVSKLPNETQDYVKAVA